MSHGEALLAIIERERRIQAETERRRRRLATLRRPVRERLIAAEATIEHSRRLLAHLRRWNVHFGRTIPGP